MQSSSSAASYTGLHWSLAVVRHDGTRVPVPSDWDVYIEFDPSGALLASDSINTMSGRYVPTTTGLRTSDMASTLMGYAGTDPVKNVVIAGMRAVVLGASPNGLSADSPTMSAAVHANVLVLSTAGYDLSFMPQGPALRVAARPTAAIADGSAAAEGQGSQAQPGPPRLHALAFPPPPMAGEAHPYDDGGDRP